MEVAALLKAITVVTGLTCTDPEIQEFSAKDLPWPAAYVRTIEGKNLIALREGIRDESHRMDRILVHELIHCGLYEDREKRKVPHPRSLDPREEMQVQAMTDVVLEDLRP